ncbi:peptidylprolyl isomerase [Parvularcula lutaonensis]|uniref:Peptidyl-prolyl cis-trans isomerase n=1 Tax=Parvularcula lutaonensis TaxID=491923 RepID=A0ABV7M7P6_9PROT|nr:peptidylprolyl isomerase [Parvularcula lutaonensis]GGY42319.1 peptidyl-prolyl cis-trans isomerase [Parvularcula lutaonensis]
MGMLKLKLETGDVLIETFEDKAPKHVEQITRLAEEGFYDGLTFHRVIDGFMAQGGCPDGTGMGGADKQLPAEFNDVSHQEGVCSMARAQDPNSASSQFFICLDDASFLDKQYTVWGKVVEGMENVHAIAKGEPPANPTKIIEFRKAD